MKFNHSLALTALVAALAAGCDNSPEQPPAVDMPLVSDENCKLENVRAVDASVRQQFADACARRGSFRPSSGKTY